MRRQRERVSGRRQTNKCLWVYKVEKEETKGVCVKILSLTETVNTIL